MSEKKKTPNGWPQGPSSRPARYVWAALVSGLLVASVLSERQSAWLPLINQAIDVLQQHGGATGNK